MDSHETGQVVASAAEVYESFFVPSLFGQWVGPVLDAAKVDAGDRVLDVGCGTGVLARGAVERVGPEGGVTGLDPNAEMLTVARSRDTRVEWVSGAAESLPFPAKHFDRVVSQFAAMFFRDRGEAMAEFARVVRNDGTVVVATWASLDETPGYAAMVEVLEAVLGSEAAQALVAPYSLGSRAVLARLLGAEFESVEVMMVPGTASFESIEAWVRTDIEGWTLAGAVDPGDMAALHRIAGERLGRFVGADGRVQFDAPANLAVATRPRR